MKIKTVRFIVSVLVGLILLTLSYFWIKTRHREEEPIRVTFDFGQPQKNRIAVLFFNNMSGSPDDEYLSDGLTEDIITRLAKIDGLNVMSATDVQRFKGRPITIKEVGKALNVDAVMEGSVRKVGETLLVTAQLIDVATGLHIWAERYERKIAVEDIFGLQNELATKIAQAAHLNLNQSAKETLTQRPTVSTEAYEVYLRGKFYHLQMTVEGNWMAIEMFQKAIELDPNFAIAYAGLGDAYANHYHRVEPRDRFWLDQASTQIKKALEMDPSLPEAHKALGHCYSNLGEHEKAAEEYQKALAVKPNYMEAQIGLGEAYCILGKYDEALHQLEEALDHHPEFSYIYYMMGCVYSMKKERDQALSWFGKAFERGFRNVELMARDSFLDPLRDDSGFKNLMKKFHLEHKKREAKAV